MGCAVYFLGALREESEASLAEKARRVKQAED